MSSMKYYWLNETGGLPDLSQYAPFKSLLSVDMPVNLERQEQISGWLINAGAMHVTIRGENCLSWKDSLRQANLDQVSIDDMQPEQFVMITTHAFEGLRSVFKQLKKHARHTHVDLNFTVIVHLAEENADVEYLSIFSRL